MKKDCIFALSLIFILFLLPNISAQCTNSQLDITTQFRAIDRNNFSMVSKYQYPYYREDDLIRVQSIHISNVLGCPSENSALSYILKTPDNNTVNAFCVDSLKIPSLKQNESYSIVYSNTTYLNFGDVGYYQDYYADSQNKTFKFCRQKLHTVGIWFVSPELEPIQTKSWAIRYSNKLYDGEFKVRSQIDILSIEQQEATLSLTRWTIIITSILGIIGVIIPLWLARREDKRRDKQVRLEQKKVLRSLEVLMNEIEAALKGHEDNLKEGIIPSYFVPAIDSSYYISQINPYVEFGVKKIKIKSTYALKQAIVRLDNKIKNINRIIDLAQNAVMLKKKSVQGLIIELTRNSYYKDAKELLSLVKRQWLNLGGFT